MATTLRRPSSNPTVVEFVKNDNEIRLSWTAKMSDITDNPVLITVTIPDNPPGLYPIWFLNTAGEKVKVVQWLKNYDLGDNDCNDDLVVHVDSQLGREEVANLEMNTFDNNSTTNNRTFPLLYK